MFSPNLNTVLDRLMTVSQVLDDAAQRTPTATEGRTRTQLVLAFDSTSRARGR